MTRTSPVSVTRLTGGLAVFWATRARRSRSGVEPERASSESASEAYVRDGVLCRLRPMSRMPCPADLRRDVRHDVPRGDRAPPCVDLVAAVPPARRLQRRRPDGRASIDLRHLLHVVGQRG